MTRGRPALRSFVVRRTRTEIDAPRIIYRPVESRGVFSNSASDIARTRTLGLALERPAEDEGRDGPNSDRKKHKFANEQNEIPLSSLTHRHRDKNRADAA